MNQIFLKLHFYVLFTQGSVLLDVSNAVRQRTFTKLHGVKTTGLSPYCRQRKNVAPKLVVAETVLPKSQLMKDAEVRDILI